MHEVKESKTINIPIGMSFLLFADAAMRKRWMKDVNPQVIKTVENKSVRLAWPDGSAVLVSFHAKARNKTQVTIHQSGLTTAKSAERQRAYWIEQLETLRKTVE